MKKVFYLFLLIMALSAGTNLTYGDNAAVITVYNPAAGVQWVNGVTYTISWFYGYSYPVNIFVIDALGATTTITGGANVANTGSIDWTPTGLPIGNTRIKIVSTHNPSTIGYSESFKILSSNPNKYITIYNPALGVKWIKGGDYNITWMDNLDDVNVTVSLVDLSGALVTTSGGLGSQLNNRTVTWTIPSTGIDNGSYKIKIVGNSSGFTATSAKFQITDYDPSRYITIYNPAYGVEWVQKENYNVTWADNVDGKIKIELLYGASFTSSFELTPSGGIDNAGSYDFSCLDSYDDVNYKFRISNFPPSGTATTTVTSAKFKILASDPNKYITIYNPALNVKWIKGGDYNITWNDNLDDANVNIDLVNLDGTLLVPPVHIGSPLDHGTQDWIIPGTVPNGSYKIKISGATSGFSQLSAKFQITDYDPSRYITIYNPAYGVEWVQKENYNVTWADNVDGKIKIELLYGASFTSSFELTPSGGIVNVGSYDFACLDSYDDVNYKIRISNFPPSGSATTTVTSAKFKILVTDPNKYITIYNPALGVQWAENNAYNVTWSDNLDDINVKIEVFGPAPLYLLASWGGATVLNNGTYPLSIPADTEEGTYKVRITGTFSNFSETSGTFKVIKDGKKSINGLATLGVNVYPNPASDKLNVTGESRMNSIWLLNQLGKTVIESIVDANQAQLDVSGLSKGIYILKVDTDGTITTHKVMIK